MINKPYRPDPSATATLPNGMRFNIFADHPNNGGLGAGDHALAAHWHAQQASHYAQQGHMTAMAFHQAQAILHAHSAQGIHNRPRPIPTVQEGHDMAEIREHNKLMEELKPFRLNQNLSGQKINHNKMVDFIKNKGKLTKSAFTDQTVDLPEVKRVEQEREPPAPALKATEAVPPGYGDILRQMIKDRRSARHGSSPSDDAEKPQLDEDQRERIRAAIARRRGGR